MRDLYNLNRPDNVEGVLEFIKYELVEQDDDYLHSRYIFKYKDKFYEWFTEYNDENDLDDNVYCQQVFPVEVTRIEYVPKIDTTDRAIKIRRKTMDKQSETRVYQPRHTNLK